MRFAILGPLLVHGPDGPVEIKAPKHRALFAMLLLSHREAAVTAERLIDALWGEDPPATAHKALQVHVSQLRRALGPVNAIVTLPAGYAVQLEPGDLDLERFETLVARARDAAPEQATEDLREALALFRGPPLADAPLLGTASLEADRIAAARLGAIEQRIEHDLALGRHTAVVPELEALAAEHPYRERLHGHLALSLYRCGRQADALDVLRRVRTSLVEDLGLDPGRELQRLESAILAHDPALEPGTGTGTRARARRRGRTGGPAGRARPPHSRDPAARPRSRPDHRRRAARRPRRPPAHAHRARRHRQDPLLDRAGPPARPGVRRWRALRRRSPRSPTRRSSPPRSRRSWAPPRAKGS